MQRAPPLLHARSPFTRRRDLVLPELLLRAEPAKELKALDSLCLIVQNLGGLHRERGIDRG